MPSTSSTFNFINLETVLAIKSDGLTDGLTQFGYQVGNARLNQVTWFIWHRHINHEILAEEDWSIVELAKLT